MLPDLENTRLLLEYTNWLMMLPVRMSEDLHIVVVLSRLQEMKNSSRFIPLRIAQPIKAMAISMWISR